MWFWQKRYLYKKIINSYTIIKLRNSIILQICKSCLFRSCGGRRSSRWCWVGSVEFFTAQRQRKRQVRQFFWSFFPHLVERHFLLFSRLRLVLPQLLQPLAHLLQVVEKRPLPAQVGDLSLVHYAHPFVGDAVRHVGVVVHAVSH